MKSVAYTIGGRTAALEVNRLYRRIVDGQLVVRIADGGLRDASPDEEAAVRAQLGDMAKAARPFVAGPATAPGTPEFDAMSKLELEAWARDHHGVELDRRRRKSALVEEVKALEGGRRRVDPMTDWS